MKQSSGCPTDLSASIDSIDADKSVLNGRTPWIYIID